MKKSLFCKFVVLSLSLTSIANAEMLVSGVDDMSKPWCYLQNSTTVMGVPYMPDAVQVTYDGAIFTRQAELCFFYGVPLQPVMQRQKWWDQGWIPIVEYNWEDHGLKYEMEMFGFPLNGENADNTVQFAKVKITNENAADAKASFAVGTRSTGIKNRFGSAPFSADWVYQMDHDQVIRNNQLIYTFSGTGALESVFGKKYETPFKGVDVSAKKNTTLCLVNYQPVLRPKESVEYTFKMPRVPVSVTDKKFIAKIEAANYEVYRAKTIQYWQNLMVSGRTQFEIPEKEVNEALKASLVQMMLATRERKGERFITDGLPYPNLFLTSFVQHEAAFDWFGFKEFVDQSLPSVYAKQDSSGLFWDSALLHGRKYGVAQGQTMQALIEHYLITNDQQYGESIYPKIKAAVGWIQNAVQHDEYHLMPPAWPYDNEMILGHYTSNNLWALLGVRSAIRLARDLGKTEDVKNWTEFEKSYRVSILKAIDSTFKEKGYVAPGLYQYVIGQAARKGFDDWMTNQEWENMLLVSPSELLSPDDPIVKTTLDHIRKDRYREGVMTYRIYLHQYITINMMDQELAMNDSRDALVDLYNVLLHLGPTYEGFENQVKPWEDRSIAPGCPTPHAWASCKLVCFIRDMLVREYGGDAGLDESKRSLYLFSLISPDWDKADQEVAIHDARTEFGNISASMRFTDSGATVKITPNFHTNPEHIVITIPYFVHLTKFTGDAAKAELKGRELILSPDARNVNLFWTLDPQANRNTFADILKRYRSESTLTVINKKEVITPHDAYLLPDEEHLPDEPLSFDLVKRAFVHEYDLRAKAFQSKGSHLETITAPPIAP